MPRKVETETCRNIGFFETNMKRTNIMENKQNTGYELLRAVKELHLKVRVGKGTI